MSNEIIQLKCSRCNQIKDHLSFHKCSANKRGRNFWCKSCTREKQLTLEYIEIQKKWRNSESAKTSYSVWRKEYMKTQKYKITQKRFNGSIAKKEIDKRYSKKYPEKALSQYAVNNAITRGDIKPAKEYPCFRCQKPASQYHHFSYLPEHRLRVIPFCAKCHVFIHRN